MIEKRLANMIFVTSLKIVQSDWLLKCYDIVIMILRSAKMIFFLHLIRNNIKHVTLTTVCILLQETASTLTFISEQKQF